MTGSPLLMAASKFGEAPGGTSSHRVAMKGKRIVTVEEMPAKLDEAVIKRSTGGGMVTARELHQKQEEFEQTNKLLGLTNLLPILEMKQALKRRLRPFPFDAKFYEEDADDEAVRYDPEDITHFIRDLSLKSDYDLVECCFVFCIQGGVDFYKDGLGQTPQCCDVLRQEFEAANDKVQGWLDMCCERTENEEDIYLGSEAYSNYRDSVTESNEIPKSKKEFIALMEQKGFPYRKHRGEHWVCKDKHCFYGLKSI